MAIHKKREEAGRMVARMLLESRDPVELPPAEVGLESVSIERTEFQAYLPELIKALHLGGVVNPVPLVQSDSLFIVDGLTRAFWVRLWHTDQTHTKIARIHVVNCLPRAANVQIRLGGSVL
jgi:hypothetical protein